MITFAYPTIAVALSRRAKEEDEDDANHHGAVEGSDASPTEHSVDEGGQPDRPRDSEAANDGNNAERQRESCALRIQTDPLPATAIRALKDPEWHSAWEGGEVRGLAG